MLEEKSKTDYTKDQTSILAGLDSPVPVHGTPVVHTVGVAAPVQPQFVDALVHLGHPHSPDNGGEGAAVDLAMDHEGETAEQQAKRITRRLPKEQYDALINVSSHNLGVFSTTQ